MNNKLDIFRNANPSSAQSAKAAANPFSGEIRSLASMSPFGKNPFLDRPATPTEVPADAPEGSYTYALVKTGPDVASEECEVSDVAVEIMILWGNSVLHVEHMNPPRSFWAGEEPNGSDFVIPADKIGAARIPVVLADRAGVAVVLPPNAGGTIEIEGRSIAVQKAVEGRMTEPCAELPGAEKLALPPGAKAKVEIGGITFQVAVVKAGRAIAARGSVDTKSLPYHGISLLLHAGVLAAAAFLMPPLADAAEETISPEQKYIIQQALGVPPAERELAESKNEPLVETNRTQGNGAEGQRSKGSEGAMGSQTSNKSGGHFGIEGPKNNMDPQIARQAALRDAATFGMIGVLNVGMGGDPHAPTAPWGGMVSLGNDSKSALGGMWGDTIDDSAGAGGLGLTGTGESGGGLGEGIGMSRVGTIGDGLGGPGGVGRYQGMRREHRTGVPKMIPQPPVTSGKLPGEIIQRIVRQNFGRFRFCYENGLRGNPNLAGRVSVRFVIGRDGSVSQVQNGGSSLPDSGVVSCVVRSFYGMSFPPPEDGIVTVSYPIMFSPSN